MNYIKVNHLTKVINNNTVLDDINFELKQGGIYSFIGHNGSGKTMLFRALCGFIAPTSGEVTINGISISKTRSFPEKTGIIIETPGFLANYTGYKNLEYLASIRNQIGEKEILAALEQVGLSGKENLKVKKYSLGMRQRLGIAQAIMEDPDLLIFDEPTNSLDKAGSQSFIDLILDLKEKGKTILLASHHIADIDGISDEIFEMEAGQIINRRKVWKKILGGILIIFVIGLFAWRVYDVKANSFSYENKAHTEQEKFQLGSSTISAGKAFVVSDADLNKYVTKDYFKQENKTLLLVQLESTEKDIRISDFQLGYKEFVTLSDTSAASYEFEDGVYKMVLGFNIPKELLATNKTFTLVTPSKYWKNGARDVVEISL